MRGAMTCSSWRYEVTEIASSCFVTTKTSDLDPLVSVLTAACQTELSSKYRSSPLQAIC